MRLRLTLEQKEILLDITSKFRNEYLIKDNLQEEMLRILLKRFIISCTRFAREKFSINHEKEKSFDIIRQFFVLVDNHFKEKKQVQDYAEMLHRSPKTLTNLFSSYGFSSPLRIIHERTEAEAKRLLLYSTKAPKKLQRFWALKTWLLSAVFQKYDGRKHFRFQKKRKTGIIDN